MDKMIKRWTVFVTALAVAIGVTAGGSQFAAADEAGPKDAGSHGKVDAESTDTVEPGTEEGEDKKLTVDQIVQKANRAAYYQGEDGKATVEMSIYNSKEDAEKKQNARSREFVILRKDVKEGGDQYFYVYFKAPPDVRKMVYRVWKHVGPKDDDRWLYTPALDLKNRIAASDERTSFVGSHFLYEDISGRGIEEDTHELVETTDKHYVLRNEPKKPKQVEFAWYKVWIDRQTFLPMKIEYHDEEGKVYRRIETEKVEEIQGLPTVVKQRAIDLKTGGQTVAEFRDVEYNVGLSDRIFEQDRYFRRAPREAR